MKNKIKLITAFILGILVTSVTVYAISVKSSNVSFTPEDETWDVKSVDDALNDLNNSLSSPDRFKEELHNKMGDTFNITLTVSHTFDGATGYLNAHASANWSAGSIVNFFKNNGYAVSGNNSTNTVSNDYGNTQKVTYTFTWVG